MTKLSIEYIYIYSHGAQLGSARINWMREAQSSFWTGVTTEGTCHNGQHRLRFRLTAPSHTGIASHHYRIPKCWFSKWVRQCHQWSASHSPPLVIILASTFSNLKSFHHLKGGSKSFCIITLVVATFKMTARPKRLLSGTMVHFVCPLNICANLIRPKWDRHTHTYIETTWQKFASINEPSTVQWPHIHC